MPPPPLALAERIDLELRIAEDEAADPAALLARDHAIGATLNTDDRVALIRGWLAARRTPGTTPNTAPDTPPAASPGERLTRALRLTRLALITAGLITGWGTAAWLLAYDGRTPVNVVHALAVLVGLQLALLLLLALGALLRTLSRGRIATLPIALDLRFLVDALLRLADRARRHADAAFQSHASEDRARLLHTAHRLRTRRTLYARAERWHLFAALQAFGIAFNLAALALILTRVALSDLAFAWATTLAIDAADLSALVRALSAPWAWIWPAAAPDAALVEATRYSRLTATYAGATHGRAIDPTRVGDWWRFLVMATALYGLLPRVILALLARRRAADALAALPLDTPDLDALIRRLTHRRVETRARDPERALPAPAGDLDPRYPPAPARTRWRAITWRDIPLDAPTIAALIDATFDGTLADTLDVPDYPAEAPALAALTATADDTRLLVLAEAFEAPDKAMRRFLRSLRAAIGPHRPITLGLVAEATPTRYRKVDPTTLRMWRAHLAAIEDPYLGLEALEPLP